MRAGKQEQRRLRWWVVWIGKSVMRSEIPQIAAEMVDVDVDVKVVVVVGYLLLLVWWRWWL